MHTIDPETMYRAAWLLTGVAIGVCGTVLCAVGSILRAGDDRDDTLDFGPLPQHLKDSLSFHKENRCQ